MAIDITKELLALQDLAYKEYTGKVNPAVPQEKVIGIRIPKLRQLAKMLLKEAKQADKSEPTQVKSFLLTYLINILKKTYCMPFCFPKCMILIN